MYIILFYTNIQALSNFIGCNKLLHVTINQSRVLYDERPLKLITHSLQIYNKMNTMQVQKKNKLFTKVLFQS